MKIRISLLAFLTLSPLSYAEFDFKQEQISHAQKKLGNDSARSSSSMVDKFEFTAGQSDKTADIVFKPLGDKSNWSLTLSAPLSDSSDTTDVYDTKTDAFANASSIKLNYRSYNAPDFVGTPLDKSKVQDLCLKSPEVFQFKYQADAEGSKEQQLNQHCFSTMDFLAQKFDRENALPKDKQLVEQFVDEQLAKPFSFYGFTATYGEEEFKYFKKDSNETTDQTEHPWATSVYYSYVVPNKVWITAELAYQKGFEAQDTVTKCPISTESTATYVDCVSSALGEPTKETNRNFSLSARFKYKKLALTPKVTHDFADDESAFSMPIYFLGNDDGDLIAGIRYDYETGGAGSKYSLFVGSKFEISE